MWKLIFSCLDYRALSKQKSIFLYYLAYFERVQMLFEISPLFFLWNLGGFTKRNDQMIIWGEIVKPSASEFKQAKNSLLLPQDF